MTSLSRLRENKSKDSSSAHNKIISTHFTQATHIKETTLPADQPLSYTRFQVVLIQEGLGNFADAHFYSRAALEGAVLNQVFEGKKIYADHPTVIENQERSVRNILGHYENVIFLVNEEGQGEVRGEVVILPNPDFDWARGILRHAVEYSKKYPNSQFVGLSVNAFGDSTDMPIDQVQSDSPAINQKLLKAKSEGVQTVSVVSHISESISVDLVTEAGAGGKIINFLEGDKKMPVNLKKKEAKKVASKESETEGANPQFVRPKEDEAKPAAPAPAPGPASDNKVDGEDPSHADAAQDKKLILDMIKKHMTDKPAEPTPQDDEEEALKLHAAYKNLGCNEEEAAMCAGKHVMLKKAAAAPAAQTPPPAQEGECKTEAEAKKEEESEKKIEVKKEDESEKKENDARSEVIALQGKIALLEKQLKSTTIDQYLDKKLEATGLTRAVTKQCRERLQKHGFTSSEKEIDRGIQLFVDSYNEAAGLLKNKMNFNFAEKTVKNFDSSKAVGPIDFSKSRSSSK